MSDSSLSNPAAHAKHEPGSKYDAIVIGSGIGGLATASILSPIANKRVLILERHFKAGGFTHVFKRKDFMWDVGIHYIGGMQEGSMLRNLIDWLTEGKLAWNKMADPFEKFVYPGLTIPVHSPEEKYVQTLKEHWPEEGKAIDGYFADVKATAGWFGRHVTLKAMPSFLEKLASPIELPGRHGALITTKEYMEHRFKSPELQAVLCSQWGDYGLPPSQSAFVIHSLIVAHYLDGGFYPVGGSGNIARHILPGIKANGGDCLLYHDVKEILLDGGQAVGVRAERTSGTEREMVEFFAPVIISDAGMKNTLMRMVPDTVRIPFRQELTAFSQGTSNVTLYLGLKDSPEKAGIQGENYWAYRSFDHDANYAARNELLEGKASGFYASFPSLKDPEARHHTAEIISFVDYEPFQAWKDKEWKNRGEDYQELKNRISEALIQRSKEVLPGFSDLIEYSELSTPITNEHFSGHPAGSIYGLSCSPERFKKEWIGIRTPVDGLFITGADASSPGFAGAMMGGFGCASQVMGLKGMMRLFKEMQ